MRVLFTTWAWPSHYYPMVPLAWAMRAAGHEVRMTSQPDLLPAMRASGLPATSVGRDLDLPAVFRTARELAKVAAPAVRSGGSRTGAGVRFSDQLVGLATGELEDSFQVLRDLEDEAISMFRALWLTNPTPIESRLSLYGELADAMTDDLLALARVWRPDLIVFDPMTYAGPLVARLLGIPAVRNVFGPDGTYSTPAMGLDPLLHRLGLTGDEVDLRGTASLDPCPPSLQFPDAIAPARRIRYRYVPYQGVTELNPIQLEGSDRARICLTWGPSAHRLLGDEAFLPGEVLLGCVKLADDRDAELVLAVTPSQRRMLPDLPGNVRIMESVPLDAVLPTCAALVHQGSAGTMLTALKHGVPQIILPQLVDEATNAFQLVAAGAGQTLPAVGLAGADLLSAGHELLDNPVYAAAARRIADEITNSPTPSQAIAELAHLVDSW